MANAILIKPLVPAAVTASSTAAGYDPAFVANDYAGVLWRANGTSTLTVDLGASPAPVDTLMLFGLGGALAGWTVQVTAADNAGFSTGVVAFAATQALLAGSAMPTSGRGVCFVSGTATTKRYWRIDIRDAGGASVDVSVARLVMGARILLERNFSFGAALGVRDLGKLDVSRRGVLLRTRGAKLRTAALNFANVRKDEVEATVKPLLERIGNTEIVALVTDPAADTQRQNRCYCGPLVGDLSVTWRNAAAWETKALVLSLF